ncbi:hypothetical protein F4778DRAFT_44305 [Xylariomycetidae sp. FL2044]|nr:hypothetical protein F4778DRAFT_44305 [Xylariomycetidae sp. FL2044]
MVKTLSTAPLLGVATHHLVFIRGKWHLHTHLIVIGHVLSFLLLLSSAHLVADGNVPLPRKTGDSIIYAVVYLTSFMISIAVYRLSFHPLRRFSGSRLAALSKLRHVTRDVSTQSRTYRLGRLTLTVRDTCQNRFDHLM